jgi:RHS repeat-associated protein
MQSAQLQTLSESPLAAKPQLSEKPRLGFETKKTAGKPGPSVCNFTVTLGLRATVIENGVRKTYSARYYNPATGRFLSKDLLDGLVQLPMTLHKYLYASGNPVNRIDPRGRADLFEYAIRSSAAVPEAKLIDIYGCVAGAALAAVDLILDPIDPKKDPIGTIGTALGGGSAVLGCVVLMPGLNELAESGAKVTKAALEFVGSAAGWGACAADAKDFVSGLNSILSGRPNEHDIGKSIEDLAGCVGSLLGQMLKAEAE